MAGRRGDLLARTVASRAAVPLSFQAARETDPAAARVIFVILLILSIPLLLSAFPVRPSGADTHRDRSVNGRRQDGQDDKDEDALRGGTIDRASGP